MYLIFDTETTGLPRNWSAPLNDLDNWPRVIQIAWQLHDVDGALVEAKDYLIQPRGFNIPFKAQDIHGISTDLALRDGLLLEEVIQKFVNVLARTKFLIGHNLKFDTNVLGAEFIRAGINPKLLEIPVLDTCTPRSAKVTKIKGRGNSFKIPKLSELHIKLFGEEFKEAHNATADVEASARCFWELVRLQHWSHDELGWDQSSLKKFQDSNKGRIKPIGLVHINFKEESALISNSINEVSEVLNPPNALGDINIKESEDFFHMHTHSQFSVLQATAKVSEMVQRVVADGQSALGITDIGNMMGAFQFIKAVGDYNRSRPNGTKELKAIIGYEAYICRNRNDKSQKDDGYQIPLLAKNKLGYHNLARLSSAGYIEGFYYVPRIDKKILLENKEGLMVTTGGLNGEIPQLILQVGEKQAEEAFLWFKNEFGSDFYAEINRHGLPEEDIVNQTLLRFCSSHNVKPVAANNAFYLDQSEAEAHDILLCVKDNEKRSTPIGRGKGFRYGFPNDQFYLTTKAEMSVKFSDIPFALSNLQDLLDKVDNYPLARQVLLPKFEIPLEFLGTKNNKDDQKNGENEYLKHLTYLGAEKRYGNVTDEIKERIDFELETIKKTGYPGYFLIVQDFCNAAREMNVTVGPGRGSAAGSAVAYCIGITNVDPISYNLLFERFLNPDRVSLPDIDIDFDDRGRDRVIQYVIDKYGSSQVAQIITYGKMAAKSSIKDAARALDLSFDQADKLTKTVPDNQSLANVLGPDEKKIREQLNGEDYQNAKNLREFYKADDNNGETLRQAKVLEGSLRNTGIHACGVIITPSDIRDLIPVAVAKDSEMWCTQFDNAAVESAGLLKMDFLGLKTLTIIKDAVLLVKKRHTISLEMEDISKDDEATYRLFQRGETVGIFQYESPGMQKHLKDLKPTVFADLIAMNALYRPGPIEYIPSFIKRKHGIEPITYDVPDMEGFLKETYGITVYQEQVMLLSQKLAGFSKGEADVLRKAMGKKIKSVLDQMKPQFINGGAERGHPGEILEKIWKDWEAFASYAFNKSHSTCYAWIAYQTAYLKANYPAEYMAAVLSNNMNDIKQVTFFMEECKRMKLDVLGPDVNESEDAFTVNEKGALRFGLLGMRGVGSAAVDFLIENRSDKGSYKNIFDFARRVDLRIVNKGTWEALALGGGFDSFDGLHRAMLFSESSDGKTFLEKIRRYGQGMQDQESSSQVSLFGGDSGIDIQEPELPLADEWNSLELLKRERDVNGIFLSAHPLDNYKFEIQTFVKNSVSEMENLETFVGDSSYRDYTIAGIISNVQVKTSRNGKEMGVFTLEDHEGAREFVLFGKQFLNFREFLVDDIMVLIRGRVHRPNWAKNDSSARLYADITKIILLSEIFEREARSIDIMSDVNDVIVHRWHELGNILRKYPGDSKVTFHVKDPITSVSVAMPSRNLKTNINQALLGEIDALDFVHAFVKTDQS